MKTHPGIPWIHPCALRQAGWLLLIPALTIALAAQPTIKPPKKALTIEWPVEWPASPSDYIARCVTTLDGGLWVPYLEPIAHGPGYCRTLAPINKTEDYFDLARGRWLMEDFDDGSFDDWYFVFADPQFESVATVEVVDGQLRVQGTCPTPCGDGNRHVFFNLSDVILADFAMSIDILGWDEQEGDIPNIVLSARIDPSYDPADPLVAYAYAAVLGMRNVQQPGQSSLGVYEFKGPSPADHLPPRTDPLLIEKTTPAKDYRFIFYGVGDQFTAQLFELSEGTPLGEPLAECHGQDNDNTLTQGWVGFYVVEHGDSGTVDFTLDNVVVVGTLP